MLAYAQKCRLLFWTASREGNSGGEGEAEGAVFVKSSTEEEGLRTWVHEPLSDDKVSHKIWEVISYLLYRTYLYLVILIWESASSTSSSSDISVCRMDKAIVIIRHYLDRAMLLKLKCKYDSPENLMKMLIQVNRSEVGPKLLCFK